MKYNTLAFTISLILSSQMANANPDGGQVIHGSATFSSPSTNVLNITNSNNAIINWQSFNIGAGQTTNFIQPGSASSVLNRVISNNPSQLLGNLNSNGKVFLINQHGILVGAGAQINTAGFLGSTLNITDNDYLNGKLKFEGDSTAGISNQGYIHAGDNGNIVLIAPNIENGGVIEVNNGNVILAAGQSITISSLENPAIQFEVTGKENTVTNLGKILVGQGSASLFAGSLKHSGLIRASGLVQNADGTISLVAKNTNQVSGELEASGTEGGYIEILGETVNIESGANINASGDMAGGEILIGGDQQGLNPEIQNARSTTISKGAAVNADANIAGNGGKVIVFADGDVHVQGEVTARGGAVSGDGGFIETSGLLNLDITSVPDATAINGKAGEWLIDPNNIIIWNSTGINISGTQDFVTTDDAAYLNVSLINSALDKGQSVTITTADADANNSSGGVGTESGDITIQASIQKTAGSDASLTLNANNNITVDSSGSLIDITSTSGIMDVIFNADSDRNGSGSVFFDTGMGNSFSSTINTNGGKFVTNTDVTINGDVMNTSSAVNILNTRWDIPFQTAVRINEDLVLDAPGTGNVIQNNGEIVIGDSSSIYYPTFDITGDKLKLAPGSLLSGFGYLTGDVTVDGGVLFGGDGSSIGTLTINGALVINSGGLYTVIESVDGNFASYVQATSLSINGGDLILNWIDGASAANAPSFLLVTPKVSVVGCNGQSPCLNASPGFKTVVEPITTLSSAPVPVDYGVNLTDTVSYTFGNLDNSGIVNWVGTSNTNWNIGSNWDTGSVPDSTSDVFINSATGIDITAAPATVRGIQAHGQIKVGTGGSLNIAGNAFILDPTNGKGGLAISAPDAKVTRTATGVLYNLGATLKLDQGTLSADVVNWGEIQTSVDTPFQIDGNLVNNSLFALDANSGTNTFTGAGSINNKGIMSWANGANLTLMDSVTLSSSSTNAQFQGSGLLTLDNNATFAINNTPSLYSKTINWKLINGTVSGVGNFDLPDQLDWYGGTISGSNLSSAYLAAGQVMNLYGTSDMMLTGGLGLDNSGTINFLSSVGNLTIDGELVNRNILNINHSNSALGFTGNGFLTNDGDVNQISANDFTLATATNNSFSQNGNLNITKGKFILKTPSSFNSGILNVDSGAYFAVDAGGKVVLGSSFQGITGAGIIEVVNGGIFDLNSLTRNSHGKDLSSLAALNVSAGLVDNIQDTQFPAIVNLSAGGVIQGADVLGLGTGFGLDIPSTTTINVNGGSFSGFDSVNTTPNNFLSIKNNGTINVLSGQTLSLLNTNLTITPATALPTPAGVLTGAGQVDVGFGSFLVADGTVDVSRIVLSGGTLTANNFSYAGDVLWTSGTVDGNGSSGLTTSGQVDLFTGVLNTDWTIAPTGIVNWLSPDSATLDINNATITNQGEFNISSYVDLTSQALAAKNFSTSSGATFINKGLLIIDSDAFPGVQGSDVIVFDLVFDNVGGTVAIKSGTFRIETGGVAQDLQLDAGESLQGYGTFDGNVVNMGGTVSPGKSDISASVFNTGTLTITGNYIQQVNGSLVIKLDSTTSGLVHDTLNVGGTLDAGGSIKFAIINGKTPVELALLLDQSFTPLTYGQFANRFSTVEIPAGLNFTYSGSGAISITSSNQDLIDISNQLETLFDNRELDHRQMVRAMRFIDKRVSIETNDEDDDDEKKRAPRLVCR